MTTKTEKFMTKEQIVSTTASIERRAGTLQNDIHRVAKSILYIWMQAKGDVATAQWSAERLTALQGASPYHANAFSKWVAEFLPCQWAAETKTWFVHEKDAKLSGKAFSDARDTPFFKVSPAPTPKPFLMLDEINRLIAKVEKHEAKPVEGDEFDVAAVKYLREAAKALTKEATTDES